MHVHLAPTFDHRQKGFTLLEVVIALAVFALLSIMTAMTLHQSLETQARLKRQSERLAAQDLALAILREDIRHMLDRPIFGNQRQVFSGLIGEPYYMEWTRDGVEHASGRLSNLERVAFVCEQGKLIRRHWPVLDTLARERYQDRVLLQHLAQCALTYVDSNHRRMNQWMFDQKMQLPLAIEVHLRGVDWGAIDPIFVINHDE